MYRLIYFTPSTGYKHVDYKSEVEFSSAEKQAVLQDAIVVCVVDYRNKAIVNKCPDFNVHREHIDHIIFDPKVMGLYY